MGKGESQVKFIANAFGITKELLGSKYSGHLTCSKEEVDHFLCDTLHDPNRELELDLVQQKPFLSHKPQMLTSL